MIIFNNLNTANLKSAKNNTVSSNPVYRIKMGLKNDTVSFSSNQGKVSKGVEIFAQNLIDTGIKGLVNDGEALLKGDFTGKIYLDNSHHEFVNSVEVKKTIFYKSNKGRKIPKETYTLGEKTFTETHHRPSGAPEKTYLRDISNKNYLSVTYHDIEGRPRVEFKLIPFIVPITDATEMTVYTSKGKKFLSYKADETGKVQKIYYGKDNQPKKTRDLKDSKRLQLLRQEFATEDISDIRFDSEKIIFKKK